MDWSCDRNRPPFPQFIFGASKHATPVHIYEFQSSLRTAGVSDHVEVHRALSRDVSSTWNRQIRFLWIDGDHTYEGAKADLDGFSKFVAQNGVIAFHDALNNFPGPIRVFVEEIQTQPVRSDRLRSFHSVGAIQSSQCF